jgi:hypothetical protein
MWLGQENLPVDAITFYRASSLVWVVAHLLLPPHTDRHTRFDVDMAPDCERCRGPESAAVECASAGGRGRRMVWGGRAPVRVVLYLATLVVLLKHKPVLRVFYERLRAAGKPFKVARDHLHAKVAHDPQCDAPPEPPVGPTTRLIFETVVSLAHQLRGRCGVAADRSFMAHGMRSPAEQGPS